MRKFCIAALLLAAIPFADAQTPDVSQDPTLAPPTCKKPVLTNTVRRADDNSDFTEKFDKYQDCVKAYVETQNKLANAHIAVANQAVADENAYIKEINERTGK